MDHIAVLGLGRMGAAIAARLADAGWAVTGWNRTPRGPLPRVTLTDDLAGVDADVVITMLTDGAAVEAVLGRARLRAGAVVVEMSTIGPDAVRAVAAGLPDGVALVDAPVGGSVGAAAAGTLRIFAGGDEADVARVRPVLDALGDVRHCGPLGSGAAAKVVLNAAMVTAVAALADALAIAEAVGLPRADAVELMRTGPLGFAAERTLGTGGPAAHFTTELAAKDLDLAIAAAHRHEARTRARRGAGLPVVGAARAVVARAVPDADIAVLVREV